MYHTHLPSTLGECVDVDIALYNIVSTMQHQHARPNRLGRISTRQSIGGNCEAPAVPLRCITVPYEWNRLDETFCLTPATHLTFTMAVLQFHSPRHDERISTPERKTKRIN